MAESEGYFIGSMETLLVSLQTQQGLDILEQRPPKGVSSYAVKSVKSPTVKRALFDSYGIVLL